MRYDSWEKLPYNEIFICDFEFCGHDANLKTPVCLVVYELRSGRTYRYWQDQLFTMQKAPFDTGPNALWVAYYSSAEWGVFRTLGWPIPERICDCFTEFSCETNGQEYSGGRSMLGRRIVCNPKGVRPRIKRGLLHREKLILPVPVRLTAPEFVYNEAHGCL